MKIKIFIIVCISLNTFIFASLSRINDTVIDSKTKLMWQDDHGDLEDKLKWIKAIEYCKKIKLGGYTNWRLPNIVELLSIADKKRFSPAISSIFKNTTSSYYWSSSSYRDSTNTVWLVNFNHGGDIALSKYDPRQIKCVRPI